MIIAYCNNKDMMKNISKSKLYNILRIIDSWSRDTDTHSEDILKNLSSLLPYEKFLCAIGDTNSLTVERLINNKFPLDYLRIYFNQKMIQNDPFVAEILFLKKSRFYDMDDYKNKSENRQIVTLNKDFGLNRGLSSIFSEPNGKTTFLCLSKPVEKPHQHYLQIVDFLMPHLHHTINRLHNPVKINPIIKHEQSQFAISLSRVDNSPSLSNRESEVLKWVMEGKTNWDISKIMSISEATVKFHLVNTFRKLDVVNRGHAVAKALQTGILSL